MPPAMAQPPPGQASMGDGDEGKPVLLSGAARASRLATAGYVAVAAGHIWLLWAHSQLDSSKNAGHTVFFWSLAVVEVALAMEALIYAVGSFGRPGACLPILRAAGRVRLLGAAMAWPWLLPWVAELACRGHAVSQHMGSVIWHQSLAVAAVLDAFFLLREVSLCFGGAVSPAPGDAALPGAIAGDCLQGQALMSGHFMLDKADLEETGRAVFVPARPRQGLYIGSGLAVLGHLLLAPFFASTGMPPWQAFGVACALLARQCDKMPVLRKRRDDGENGKRFGSARLWSKEGPRIACRLGELCWIAFCILELRRREAQPGWLASCDAAVSPQ